MGAEENPFVEAGNAIRRLREEKGLSRQDVAKRLDVDVSSLAGWEAGKRLPRDKQRACLSRILGVELGALFPPAGGTRPVVAAALVDTLIELPDLLMDCTRRTQTLRALRLAAPYTTSAYVQIEWRNLVAERVLNGSLEVQRIEIFYNLKRLQETLSNILRYDGRAYYVKCHCAGLTDVAPAMGGYFFENDFLLGAYWTGIPPHRRPGLHLSGEPFRTFYNEYWAEIWQRGTYLNPSGKHDLSGVRDVAEKLGLTPRQWSEFVEQAKELEVGDGAPPLV